MLEDLATAGVKVMPIIDHARPTTHKNAYVCGDYRLLKVDTLDNRSLTDAQVEKISAHVQKTPARAVVFSDFRHGIFNRRTIPALIGAIPRGVFRVADSQVASRWGNILEFKGFDLLTPNEREARFALADQDTGVRPLVAKLHEDAECKTVILKLGDRGVLTCRAGRESDPRTFFVVDSFVERVVDAVGAGDALLAYATLSLLVELIRSRRFRCSARSRPHWSAKPKATSRLALKTCCASFRASRNVSVLSRKPAES